MKISAQTRRVCAGPDFKCVLPLGTGHTAAPPLCSFCRCIVPPPTLCRDVFVGGGVWAMSLLDEAVKGIKVGNLET